jgi:hypothetical protein
VFGSKNGMALLMCFISNKHKEQYSKKKECFSFLPSPMTAEHGLATEVREHSQTESGREVRERSKTKSGRGGQIKEDVVTSILFLLQRP